ncbi:MAG: 50S ribosomal protein L13 [Candidatus Sungbacteria bacterium]|nr:50S ribosomal protein L13 [Candidatus Sungbacteria bacterium]
MEYKIDATDKILGRLATEVSILLRGKNNPGFDPAKFTANRVIISNTDKIRVSGKKLTQKLYRRHSGFHGGLREEKLRELLARDSCEVLRKAVMGMLPKNKLRARYIKNLILLRAER